MGKQKKLQTKRIGIVDWETQLCMLHRLEAGHSCAALLNFLRDSKRYWKVIRIIRDCQLDLQ